MGAGVCASESSPSRMANHSLASMLESRKKSYPLPWNLFVPERVIMFTTEAPENPYSALKFVCCTLNSSTASGDGRYVAEVMPPLGSEFVTEAPSLRMSEVDPRLPLETKLVPVQSIPHWSSIVVTPGANDVRFTTLRLMSGRSLMKRRFTN